MAKPIEATPTLEGRDAEEFIENLLRRKYTPEERRLFEEMKELQNKLKNPQ